MTISVLTRRILSVCVLVIQAFALAGARDGRGEGPSQTSRKAVIYVMPDALAGPSTEGAAVIADSAHNGREPQVAKIYHELQQSKNCQNFSENMIKEKADYFLLLQHGGGRGNRWAASDREGNVIASGESFKLGTSVNDACVSITKDWQQRPQTSSVPVPDHQ